MPLLWREVAVQDALEKFTVAHALLGIQMRKEKEKAGHPGLFFLGNEVFGLYSMSIFKIMM